MKQLLVTSLTLCSLVACSSNSPTAPSPSQQTGFTLTALASPFVGGSIAVSPLQAQFASGSSVSLTATAAPGYQFSGWQGDLIGSTNPVEMITNTNKTVTAVFTATEPQPGRYTLSVYTSPLDGGSVAVSPDETEYASGTTVMLTATAASGYRFLQWEGDAYGTGNPTWMVMNNNSTVKATFIRIPVTPLARIVR